MTSWLFTASADRDLADILDYAAEHQRDPSVHELMEAMLDQIELIAAHPLAFPSGMRGLRHSVMSRLPYRFSYSFNADIDRVCIMAITHTRRALPRTPD